MSAKHGCMIDECERDTDITWAICRDCYRLLPRDITDEIGRAYVRSVGMGLEFPSPALNRALVRAKLAIVAFLTAQDSRGSNYTPAKWEALKAEVRARDEARAARRAAAGPQPPKLELVP